MPTVPKGGRRFRQGVGSGRPPAQEPPRTEPRGEIRAQPVFKPRGDAPVKLPSMFKESRFDDNRGNRARRSWQREVLVRPEEVRPAHPVPESLQKNTHGWFGGSQPASQPSETSGDLKSNEHPKKVAEYDETAISKSNSKPTNKHFAVLFEQWRQYQRC